MYSGAVFLTHCVYISSVSWAKKPLSATASVRQIDALYIRTVTHPTNLTTHALTDQPQQTIDLAEFFLSVAWLTRIGTLDAERYAKRTSWSIHQGHPGQQKG